MPYFNSEHRLGWPRRSNTTQGFVGRQGLPFNTQTQNASDTLSVTMPLSRFDLEHDCRSITVHLLLQLLRVALLEARRLPRGSGCVLTQEQRAAHDLTALDCTVCFMTVVRDQREHSRVWKEDLVITWLASSRENLHYVLAIVYIDAVANQHQSVDTTSHLIA